MSAHRTPPVLDIDALIDNPRTKIIVCCGSGGVGKTTAAAALGLRAAERGRDVVVLTVDPARRLAQSMGLSELDNNPRRIDIGSGTDGPGTDGTGTDGTGTDGSGTDGSGATEGGADGGGELHAMMLDMKGTFDEIVEAHADPDRAQQILANPFYQSLSSSLSGTQEYMAMEKLGQLHRSGAWDLIIVDTPPSRNALDFLDAPERMGRFLDGRFMKILAAPAKTGGRFGVRMLTAGFGVFTGVLNKVVGVQLLRDVQTFVTAFDTVFGGFRERADKTFKLLQTPGTAFLVVAAPEPDALREASYFVERLGEERMPLAGLVINRVHEVPATLLNADSSTERAAEPDTAVLSQARSQAAAETLAERGDHRLTSALLRLHAERMQRAAREERLREHFASAHPSVPVATAPAQAEDVHDLAGLRQVAADLADNTTRATPAA